MLAQRMEECIAAAQITLGSKGAIDAVALVPALVDGMADADADVTFANPLAGVHDDRSTDLSLAERVQGGAEDAKAMADAKMKQAQELQAELDALMLQMEGVREQVQAAEEGNIPEGDIPSLEDLDRRRLSLRPRSKSLPKSTSMPWWRWHRSLCPLTYSSSSRPGSWQKVKAFVYEQVEDKLRQAIHTKVVEQYDNLSGKMKPPDLGLAQEKGDGKGFHEAEEEDEFGWETKLGVGIRKRNAAERRGTVLEALQHWQIRLWAQK